MKNGSNVIITVYLINVGTRYKLVVRSEKHYLLIVYFGGEEIDETYSLQTPPG